MHGNLGADGGASKMFGGLQPPLALSLVCTESKIICARVVRTPEYRIIGGGGNNLGSGTFLETNKRD